ncbi:heme-binding domain-containing protein [Deinococcus depolymerans]|uniref:Heme-binding domain-containing protein n=1 Tax=Deinococcus depolymerans TaxID=392408 RepID=A0ABP3LM43_9DEIO
MNLNPTRRSLLPRLLLGLLALFVLIQFVPYGRAHANPTVQTRPKWDDPRTEALFTRACADCHSHATVWPWYSHVAPVSWLVQRHVDEGRSRFNVNVPGFGREADEAASEVRSGGMPEPTYLPLHPTARLSAPEREQLAAGLEATFGSRGGGR